MENHGSSPSASPLAQSGDWRGKESLEYLFKILVIGDIGTGKTSIIKRYVHNFYSPHYRATIGVDFAMKVLHWDDGAIVRLQLWDIAGQERFGNMTRVYYKEASGAFIVFDVTRPATFEGVNRWKSDLDAKCDLEKAGVVTKPQEMDDYCSRHGFVGWAETSAKENTGIGDAANHLINNILAVQKAGQYEIPVVQRDNETWKLNAGQENARRRRKKCCF